MGDEEMSHGEDGAAELHWTAAVDSAGNKRDVEESLARICEQVRGSGIWMPRRNRLVPCAVFLTSHPMGLLLVKEREGGRMQQSQLGVIREDPQDDMRVLVENFTGE